MSAQFVYTTVLVWSAQICILVALAALASLMLTHVKARLWFWQGLLLILLLLPVIQPWRARLPEGIPALSKDHASSATAQQTIILTKHHRWGREDLLLVLALGAAARLLWIAVGFMRLRRYRAESRRLGEVPVPFGTSTAEWYLHDHLAGPVTYGWIRPRILLPARFEQMESSLREAIACHELVHVWRRDWLFVIAEEVIRCAFWFHPAVWLVLSRIQLAREQVVDREVIRLTRDRDHYLDALVAVAAHKIQPDLAPAPLFLKKRHLARRVAAVLQEVSMSRPRLYAALTTVCAAVLLAARISVWLIPFTLPAQALPDDPGIAVEPGGTILHRTPVHLPADVKTRGTVVLEVSLGTKGEVSDARVVSGPLELRKAALGSVLDWHYQAGASQAEVTIKFGETSAQAAAPTQASASVLPPGFNPTFRSDPTAAVDAFPAVLKSITIEGLRPDAERELRNRLAVHEGDTVRLDDVAAAFKTVHDFDEHLMPTVYADKGEASLLFTLKSGPVEPGAALATADFPPPAAGVQRIRVGGNVQQANLIKKVTPKYPQEAKDARMQGTTRFAALIGTDGAIRELHLVSGPPLLGDSATEALKQWLYKPTLLNGVPVEVSTRIDVNFTLLN
jgi:beta-lactamase regulating signal transducer with metallopeptidase domain